MVFEIPPESRVRPLSGVYPGRSVGILATEPPLSKLLPRSDDGL